MISSPRIVSYPFTPKYKNEIRFKLDHQKKDKSQITNHKSQITNHKSQITNHKSQITNHKSQITNHKSQITNQGSLFFQQ